MPFVTKGKYDKLKKEFKDVKEDLNFNKSLLEESSLGHRKKNIYIDYLRTLNMLYENRIIKIRNKKSVIKIDLEIFELKKKIQKFEN